ncbi:MAG: CPBP family intramembrane metalloprotease [Deltaproteobacteria bacterium]|nr:CPBP family intramembrane metalloprotease [Deltaproteobacteria bacterium]
MPPTETSRPPYDAAAEWRMAWRLVLVVLVTLTVVKPLGSVAIVGTVAFTLAALLQLYLPLWRADRLGHDYDFVGLHLKTWRRDLKIVLILCTLTFPPFIVGHHLYMTRAHEWIAALGLADWLQLPRRELAPSVPEGWVAWAKATGWFLQMAATHSLGVALPEETFYRGYLQPQLEERWPARMRVFGVGVGRAAIVTAALFALGHFLGEWNPLRLGPFFPALVFAWQRNATGSVVGAITFHALCNILGEVLFSLYKPV